MPSNALSIWKKFKRILKRIRLSAFAGYWNLRSSLGLFYQSKFPELKICAVILSYKRTENIDIILSALASCGFVKKIVLSNNNPDIHTKSFVKNTSGKIVTLNQSQRTYAWIRFDLAYAENYDYFLFVDDDVFLFPCQLRVFCESLYKDPSRPYGILGSRYSFDSNKSLYLLAETKVAGELAKVEETDVVHQAYVCTKKHLEKYHNIIKKHSLSKDELRICDDILLSFSGEKHPAIVGMGKINRCESSFAPGVALHVEEGFLEERSVLYSRLKKSETFIT